MDNGIRSFRNLVLGVAICLLLVGVVVNSVLAQPPALQFTAEQQQQIDEAMRLEQHAKKLFQEEKFKEAIPVMKQVVAIRQKVLGNEHLHTLASMNNLSLLLLNQHEFAEALLYLEQLLKLHRKVLGDESPDVATTMAAIGDALRIQLDFATARSYMEQALKIRRKVLGEEHVDTAQSLNYLGILLTDLRDYTGARPYLEQALAIYQRLLGNENYTTILAGNSLGIVLWNQGDYAAARPFYEQLLRFRKRNFGDEHPATAEASNNLGLLLSDQGDYAAARPYLEQALKIRRKKMGDEHSQTETSLTSLGTLHLRKEDYAAARPYLEESLRINRKVLGDEHPETAKSLNHLGMLLWSQGDITAARTYLEESLKIKKKVLGDEALGTGAALGNLALVLRSQGDYAAARPYYEQSLKIYRQALGDDHPSTTMTLNQLLILEGAIGNWEAAAKMAEQCRRGVRRHIARALPALSEKEQLLFLENNDESYFHEALSLGMARPHDPKITAQSAGWLLNGKGVAHAALAEKALLTRDLTDPKLAPVVQELSETRRQLATLTLSTPKPDQAIAHQAALEKLTRDEDRLARQLSDASGRTTNTDPWVELPRLRKALPADSVLIDIARFPIYDFKVNKPEKTTSPPPSRYVAWIVPTADKGEIQIIDLGPADAIEASVEAARKSIQAAMEADGLLKQEGEDAAEKQTREHLQKVADLVWKPLADKLGGAKQVILSPDGALWLCPWGALPVADDKVLLEVYPLRYVISGRDVVNLNTKTYTHSLPAIFADPNFDLSATETRKAIHDMFPKRNFNNQDQTRGLTSQNALPRVNRLPNTATEAQAITPNIERFAKEKAQAFTDRYALESAIKAVERPSLLVLSTHGFFLPDQEVKHDESNSLAAAETRAVPLATDGKQIENPLLRCGLLLAGCNSQQTTVGDDGILTGMEIVSIDLRGTDLVVLSACETGIGKIRNGEGVAGLRQAFQLAGAKSVVATLWQVPDRDSMLIMNDFFQNLADGQSKTESLRNAQLKRIEARREKNGAAHPFFWAAWTLTGE